MNRDEGLDRREGIDPISVTQDPNSRPAADAWQSLPFFGTMQALWQPLSLLTPPGPHPRAAVTTWFIDRLRYPQSFDPRTAWLSVDPSPGSWLAQMRTVWYDVILPHKSVAFHIVQPPPPADGTQCRCTRLACTTTARGI